MPTELAWETYFKALTSEQRHEIWKSLDTLLNYSMFVDSWNSDFRSLRLILEYIGI